MDGTANRRACSIDSDSCARRKWLIDWVSVVPKEPKGKTNIELDGLGEVGDQKRRFVKGEDWRAMVAFGDGVVEEDTVGSVVSSNGDAVKRLSLGG